MKREMTTVAGCAVAALAVAAGAIQWYFELVPSDLEALGSRSVSAPGS
jgi:hypothetical protein